MHQILLREKSGAESVYKILSQEENYEANVIAWLLPALLRLQGA
jgi:hypothetical protein